MKNKKIRPMLQSKNQGWRTPLDLFMALDKEFKFDADVANNNGITYFNRDGNGNIDGGYHVPCDSLITDWHVGLDTTNNTYFLNPPYKTKLQNDFIKKASQVAVNTGSTVVCLIPVRTSSKRWTSTIREHATEVRFLTERIKFEGAENVATFDSAIVIFNWESLHKDSYDDWITARFWHWLDEND